MPDSHFSQRLALIACALFGLSPLAANSAEIEGYQVELIVLMHLNQSGSQAALAIPGDFSATLDFAQPVEQAEDEMVETAELPDVLDSFAESLPEPITQITTKSTRMEGVWQRLRSSADFRPLVYIAWEQSREINPENIRVSDYQVLYTESDKEGEISPVYQLDGLARFRRNRFLHINLDLEYRLLNDQQQPVETEALGIHRLRQQRQIRSERLEYFDAPFMGVLAYITPIEAEEPADNQSP